MKKKRKEKKKRDPHWMKLSKQNMLKLQSQQAHTITAQAKRPESKIPQRLDLPVAVA